MFKKSKKGYFTDTKLEVAPGQNVPLRIYSELRSGYRASIGKKQVIFRLPLGINQAQYDDFVGRLTDWARQTFRKDPMHFAHLLPQSIPDQGQVIVMGNHFQVQLQTGAQRKSHLARFAPDDPQLIQLELAGQPPEDRYGHIVETLISRLSSQRFLPQVSKRVLDLNDQHFRQPVSGVTLKLTKSQWGSCSTKGNINLSSRLLLVPAPTRDAVIVHELAHRIEMNHGPRFWKLVYDAMPDYDEHHAYLSKYARELSFLPI